MDTEVSSAQLEAGAGAAGTAGPSGSGPAAAEAIDLSLGDMTAVSLDDIIKKNKKKKKGQTKLQRRPWGQPLKNRNPADRHGGLESQGWGPQNLQGPSRFRGGFGKQQFYKKRFWNGGTRPGQKTPGRPSGRSPLHQPALAEQAKAQGSPGGGGEGGAAADASQGPPPRVKRFRLLGGPPLPQRPFRKNQWPSFFQKQSRFNFRQRQVAAAVQCGSSPDGFGVQRFIGSSQWPCWNQKPLPERERCPGSSDQAPAKRRPLEIQLPHHGEPDWPDTERTVLWAEAQMPFHCTAERRPDGHFALVLPVEGSGPLGKGAAAP
ncbi:hypothetical protein JRQ81_007300 [Phrynocephalus forsythii]|uniref:UAP56-interacting factor n=1 Tax=Phrynocephalus forsythii TaxID=171643 RepID=A0A9Q1AU29_9SAUR|nr:hypothetical protein JRQ81_007300 [Phrynocephalus forsythii]